MDLIDPFSEIVVFGKAFPVAWPPQGETRLQALLPTGRHVSHANDLKRVSNSSGGGGKATRLERYTTNGGGGKATKLVHVGHRRSRGNLGLQHTRHASRGFKPGPFKKALEDVDKGLLNFGGRAARKAQVARGLRMATGPSPEVSRGLKMAAGHTGRMPLTGGTGTNVIAPTRRDSMLGAKAKAPIGSKYLTTDRANHMNPAYGNGYKGRHAGYRSADSKGVESTYQARHSANSPVNSSIPTGGKTGRRIGGNSAAALVGPRGSNLVPGGRSRRA